MVLVGLSLLLLGFEMGWSGRVEKGQRWRREANKVRVAGSHVLLLKVRELMRGNCVQYESGEREKRDRGACEELR